MTERGKREERERKQRGNREETERKERGKRERQRGGGAETRGGESEA